MVLFKKFFIPAFSLRCRSNRRKGGHTFKVNLKEHLLGIPKVHSCSAPVNY